MKVLISTFLIIATTSLAVAGLRAPSGWSERAKLTASDAAEADLFGWRVALDGDTALIGSWYDDDGGEHSGSAYVFVGSGTSWSQQAKLTASDGASFDELGSSVSISGDTALVGAHYDGTAGYNAGSAYVFVRSGTSWSQQAELIASDTTTEHEFGWSVSACGDTALVGAYRDDEHGIQAGAAYVFVRSGTVWSEQAKLTAADAATADNFGYAVALSGDTALVGARYDDDAGNISGSAYVFVRSGTSWAQQAKLVASDADAGDEFGFSVALCADTALIGAIADDHEEANEGSAYVFVRSGTSWSQQAKVWSEDTDLSDLFGYSVSVNGDTALVGCPYLNGEGAAYSFHRMGTSWNQEAELSSSDAEAGDGFGLGVAVSGSSALIGVPNDDDVCPTYPLCDSGAAYVFERGCPTPWQASETTRLGFPPNPHAFLPGVTTGPVVGATWDPVVTRFQPGDIAQFIGVDLNGPLNVPTQWGTLLIWPPPNPQLFWNAQPGTPFSLPVPNDCALVGQPAWAQALSVDFALTIVFANGLDLVFGTY
jgi:hypothetical protein